MGTRSSVFVTTRWDIVMLPLHRQRRILAHVAEHGSSSVADLADLCRVSEMTIRRDLMLLERNRAIRRTHGGAVSISSPLLELTFDAKVSRQRELKDRLARFAVKQCLHDGMVISLEGGTTITAVAQHIDPKSKLTILTNGVRTAAALLRLLPECTVICSGGTLREVSHTMVGPLAEQFFTQFHAQTAFFSAIGMTPEHGFVDADLLESEAKRAMAAGADRRILLLDSTKFGVRSFKTTFRPAEIDVLITDEGAPRQTLDLLARDGVEILVAPPDRENDAETGNVPR